MSIENKTKMDKFLIKTEVKSGDTLIGLQDNENVQFPVQTIIGEAVRVTGERAVLKSEINQPNGVSGYEVIGEVALGDKRAVSGEKVLDSLFKNEIGNKVIYKLEYANNLTGYVPETLFSSGEILLPNDWVCIELDVPNSVLYGVSIGGKFFNITNSSPTLEIYREDFKDDFIIKFCIENSRLVNYKFNIYSNSEFKLGNIDYETNYKSFNSFVNDTTVCISSRRNTYIIDTKTRLITGFSVTNIADNEANFLNIECSSSCIYASCVVGGVSKIKVFDISNSPTYIGYLDLDDTDYKSLKSIKEFNGVNYATIDINGKINNGVINSDVSNTRVDILTIDNITILNKKTITNGLENFFNSFTSDEGQLTRTLVPQRLSNSFLFINNGSLYCSLVSLTSSSAEYDRKVFVKKINTDLSHSNKSINDIIRSAGSCCYIDNSSLMVLKRFNQYNFTNWSFTVNEVFDEDSKKSNLLKSSSNTSLRTILAKTYLDKVCLCEITKIGSVYYLSDSVTSKKELYSSIYPNEIKNNNLSDIGYSKFVFGKTDILDYFDLNNKKQRINHYIDTIIGEVKLVINNGHSYPNFVQYNSNKSPKVNNFLHALPENNNFGSKAFRIPVLTKMTNGDLISAFDVRKCTGWDYDEIDGGISISKDGGVTWGDYKIIFPRIKHPGFRTHDLCIVVDSDLKSNQYGRVWAIAKSWNANVNSTNTVWWNANHDKFDVLMTYSDDNGITWNEPYSIKSMFNTNLRISGGCQAGICLSNGTIVMNIYRSDNRVALMYKELNAMEWKVTDFTPENIYVNESSSIQDLDDSILVSCRSRNNDRLWFRKETIDSDWIQDNTISIKKDVVCQNSFFRHKNKYYYIQPNFELNPTNGRGYLTLYVSNNLINWEVLYQLTSDVNGATGYSAIYVDDNILCAIYEDSNMQLGYAVPEIKSIDLSCYL